MLSACCTVTFVFIALDADRNSFISFGHSRNQAVLRNDYKAVTEHGGETLWRDSAATETECMMK